MPFSWDDYPVAGGAPQKPEEKAFDWGAMPIAEEPKEIKPREISQGETATRHGIQGLTAGFADEATGVVQSEADKIDSALDRIGVENPSVRAAIKTGYGITQLNPSIAAINAIKNKLTTGEFTTPEYRGERDIERSLNKETYEANPKTAIGFNILGSVANPLNYIGGEAAQIPKAASYGSKIARGAWQGAKAAAPVGALYGLGGSEGETAGDVAKDTAKTAALTTAFGGLFGAGQQAVKPLYDASVSGLRRAGQWLSQAGEDIKKPPVGQTQSTAPAEKAIQKQIVKLEKSQAEPEAEILKTLSKDVGKPEGIATREKALMSPLTREKKNAQFFEDTKALYNRTRDNFEQFEKNIRFKEAEKNLGNIPAKTVRKPMAEDLVEVNTFVKNMGKEENALKYDQSAVSYLDSYMKDFYKQTTESQSAYDVYVALNDAKKKIATLAKYGKEVKNAPKERGTIEAVQNIKSKLDGLLENEEIFGNQAARHRAINESYNKFLTGLKNMQRSFTKAEATEVGRPIQELSSTSMGTYSRQLDTIHGADRRRFLDQMLEGAEALSGTIDESANSISAPGFVGSKPIIEGYKKAKDAFANEMTLSNQLRRLRWDDMVSEGAKPRSIPQVAVESTVNAKIPGLGPLTRAMRSGAQEQTQTNQLIRQLLNRETQRSPSSQMARESAGGALDKIGITLQNAPHRFGKFAGPLLEAAQKGPTAMAVTNYVLHQTNPEFQQITRQIQDEEETEGER